MYREIELDSSTGTATATSGAVLKSEVIIRQPSQNKLPQTAAQLYLLFYTRTPELTLPTDGTYAYYFWAQSLLASCYYVGNGK